MILTNRQSSNPSMRKLDVSNITYNSDGSIKSMDVLVSRKDIPTVTGTKLNREELGEGLVKYINHKIFGIKESTNIDLDWTANHNEKTIVIESEFMSIYPTVVASSSDLQINNTSYSNSNKTISIKISPKMTTSNSFDYYINLYTDSSKNNFLTRIFGHVDFSQSTNNVD